MASSSYSLRLAWGAGAQSWGTEDGQRPVLEAAAKPPRRGQRAREWGLDLRVEGKSISTHTTPVTPCSVLSLAETP